MTRPRVSDLAKVRLLYFLQCSTGCCIGNFLQVFLRAKGLTLTEIGLMSGAIAPFISMLGNPLWAFVADRTRRPKMIMMGALIVSTVLSFTLQFVDGFQDLAIMFGISSLVASAVSPLLDSSTMTTIKENGIPLAHYGRFRVYGAIGWGITAPTIGALIDHFGQDVMFYSYAVMSTLYILTMAWFPVHTDAVSKKTAMLDADDIESVASSTKAVVEEDEERLKFREYFKQLLTKQDVPLFLCLVFAMGICKGVIDVFLFLHLQDLGASNVLMGISLLVTTCSEIPFFFFSGSLIQRFGTLTIVLAALLVYDGRLLYYSELSSPWLVLPGELLHGITFALSWATVASHAAVISPKGYATTTQGILSSLYSGFGFGVGAVAGGYINNIYGARKLFRYTALFATVVIVLGAAIYIAYHLLRKKRAEGQAATAEADSAIDLQVFAMVDLDEALSSAGDDDSGSGDMNDETTISL